jgi:hypothetical protein
VERHSTVTGDDALAILNSAKAAAAEAIAPHIQRLSERAVEKVLREEIFRHLPRKEEIAAGTPINISIDVVDVVTEERNRLQAALDIDDLSAIIAHYPIRETPALTEIADKLGFKNRDQYEGAVRKLLTDDNEALVFVQSLFGTLAIDINSA